DPRKHAMHLYFNGYRVARIAEMLNEKSATIHSWKRRDKWDDVTPFERVELSLEVRLCKLIAKEQKEGKDFKEIDLLYRQLERQARINKYSHGGNEADLNPKV
ncbi:terminase gpP N-terminus-related DNA-binding protein, partial [Xenorhabdus bovienii]|uniref:terminase gpP N-terminus-related DNA-binding protein n=1 Tax=Xenorhabdus bovienii TaxID=40576 RepID=UPI003DA5ED18